MCQWAFMCDWGGFCGAFTLQLIFSGLPRSEQRALRALLQDVCVRVRACVSLSISVCMCICECLRYKCGMLQFTLIPPCQYLLSILRLEERELVSIFMDVVKHEILAVFPNPVTTCTHAHRQKCKDTLHCLYTLEKWKFIARTWSDRTTAMTKLKRGLEILQSIGFLVQKPSGCWFLVWLEKIQQIDVCWVWKKQHEGEQLGKPAYLIKLMDLPIQTCKNENKQRTVQVWPR